MKDVLWSKLGMREYKPEPIGEGMPDGPHPKHKHHQGKKAHSKVHHHSHEESSQPYESRQSHHHHYLHGDTHHHHSHSNQHHLSRQGDPFRVPGQPDIARMDKVSQRKAIVNLWIYWYWNSTNKRSRSVYENQISSTTHRASLKNWKTEKLIIQNSKIKKF